MIPVTSAMYQTQSQFDQVEDGCLNEILLKEWVSLLVHRLDIMVGVAAPTNEVMLLLQLLKV